MTILPQQGRLRDTCASPRPPSERRRVVRFGVVIAAAWLFFASAVAAQPAAGHDHLPRGSSRSGVWANWKTAKLNGFLAVYPPGDPDAEREARSHAAEARRAIDRVADSFPRAFGGQIALIVLMDERTFAEATGIVEPSTPAAARGEPPTIYVNARPMRAMAPIERDRVYAHEYTHVFVGRHARAPLPLWLDEGIAQLVAGESPDELTLAAARLFGGLPRLSSMSSRFPSMGASRSLAYSMSRSVVGYLAREKHPIEGVRGLLRELADEQHGPSLIDFYSTPVVMDNIQTGWEASLGLWVMALRVLSDETTQWILLSGAMLVAYVIVKARRRRRLAAMDEPPKTEPRASFGAPDGPIWSPEYLSPPPAEAIRSFDTASDAANENVADASDRP